jgi:NADH:ubiquinone oxidoreductase subunit 3 (subunit A)
LIDLFVNPVTLFLGALLVAGLLYLWGRSMAPPSQPGGYKQQMYTGGEAPKEQEIRPSYRFYHIALFFTILHVALLVLVTVPSGPAAWLALTYLGIISLAVAALVWRGA